MVAANKPIVEAHGIHKHFGALHVLKGVDLVLAERELVFVIGPSGPGTVPLSHPSSCQSPRIQRCFRRVNVRYRAG